MRFVPDIFYFLRINLEHYHINTDMSGVIKLKRGFDINLKGKAEKKMGTCPQAKTFAIKPEDFIGMYRPKLLVSQGDTVKAGTPLFYDKQAESVKYCSPVSGEVVEVVRGPKRKLLEIRILADSTIDYFPFEKYTVSEAANLTADEIKPNLLESGVWPQIIRRPYGVVADPSEAPEAVYISAFDTHPLAPDYDFLFKGREQYFRTGLDILAKVAQCPVHLNIDNKRERSKIFVASAKAEVHEFSGPHPAGNVGVQIHHISPLHRDKVVWTLNPYGLIQIGKLFLEGRYDASKIIALTGSEVKKPQYYSTFLGACISNFVQDNLTSENVRFVSGNILTGTKIGRDGYLSFYDHMLTVLPEGDRPRFMLTEGWLAPTTERLSFHRAFGLLSFLNSDKKEYRLDTSNNGEERTFVQTGAFEKVLPMDILPVYLFKAILAGDYDETEALGIYEVVEEDVALCEFIDVSKQPLQSIVREGINKLREG